MRNEYCWAEMSYLLVGKRCCFTDLGGEDGAKEWMEREQHWGRRVTTQALTQSSPQSRHSPRAAVSCLGCEGVYHGVHRVWVREKTLTLALDGVGGCVVVLTLFLSRSHFCCLCLVFSRCTSEAGVLLTEGKVKCESRPCPCGPPGLSPLWILLALPHRQMGIRGRPPLSRPRAFPLSGLSVLAPVLLARSL